ncbi:RapZ C-terminal domain-containing protein [Saccharopolyspora taberi]|uniref:RapZ C-terminal domain-containing protein n=1 Tax=Saccharopolyspora taberi TaxID=60895 RepID=A0ABN3VBQ9_9PSEU
MRQVLLIHSFGYRAGPPPEWSAAPPDVVEDVRSLINPYKLAEYHDLSGLDAPVREFVVAQPKAQQILDRAEARILALIDAPSRPILRAGFGCTGGKDRSVALAAEFATRAERWDADLDVVLRHWQVHERSGADRRGYE